MEDEVRKIWSFGYFCPWSCMNLSVNVILCEILMKVMECHELLQRWFEWYVSIMVPFYFVCKMNRIFIDLFSYWISWVEMGFPRGLGTYSLPRNFEPFPEFADIKALLPDQESLATVRLDHDMTTSYIYIYMDSMILIWLCGMTAMAKAFFLVFQWCFLTFQSVSSWDLRDMFTSPVW